MTIVYGGLVTVSESYTPDNRRINVSILYHNQCNACYFRARALHLLRIIFALLLLLFPGLLSEPQGLLLLPRLWASVTVSESDGLRPG